MKTDTNFISFDTVNFQQNFPIDTCIDFLTSNNTKHSFLVKDSLYFVYRIGCSSKQNIAELNNFYRTNTLCVFKKNILHKTLGSFPSSYLNKDYLSFQNFTVFKNEIVLSFSHSHEIDIYSLAGNLRTSEFKHNKLKENIIPFKIEERKNTTLRTKYVVENFFYGKIVSSKQHLFRVYKYPSVYEKEGEIENVIDSEWEVIIHDENYNYMGFLKIAAKEAILYKIYPTSNGFILNYNHPLSKNKDLKFVKYEISN